MVFGMFSKTSDRQAAAHTAQASDNVQVTSVTKRPRAIVVLFGHLGATCDQLNSYAQLYQEYNCSTICATAPILSLVSNDVTMLGEVAITACRETARLIRMAEMSEMGFGRVPVVCHVLGNGGAKVLEEMEKRIHEVIPKSELQDMVDGTAMASSTPLGSRRRMMKSSSGSARSLMGNHNRSSNTSGSGSSRNLMKPALVKSTSAPTHKGSTRSVLTATSLSDEEDHLTGEPEERRSSADSSSRLKEKLGRLRGLKPPRIDTKTAVHKQNRSQGHNTAASPACVVTSPHLLLVPQCGPSSNKNDFHANNDYHVNSRELSFLGSDYDHNNILPQCIDTAATAAVNPLQQRLERRRRRKRSSPQVKRIDMERSGLHFAADHPRYNPEDRAYQMDMELFASRLVLGSIVFDSGPYYPSVEKEMATVEELLGGRNSNPATKLLALSAIVASHGWHGLTHFNYLGYVPTSKDHDNGIAADDDDNANGLISRPAQFWNNMTDMCLSKRHAYIYSQADQICQRDSVRNLIRAHKLKGIHTIEIELIASRHLQHRKRRVDKYSEFVERVVNSLEGRRMDVQESVAEWFDSDDDDDDRGHEIVQQQEEERESSGRYNIVETGSRIGVPETVAG
mmetsp:Transcript_13742/g.22741  ORF Transcript_13742/g.22741 Transcript_13742/m.22741 type:complete len:624 (-) Transcript_13742:158-2029(-)|eukprot:CAMPEP_0119026460 /NCGR_PEP_ID=MMETSP1176-20130426/35490_1 /TAXON_ID=265551 /ORGANISM="Synedropsis recta cf, Strain CCMP1620" /LENGTH=623 /DNA_ID=CAMNT_0006982173 /DNA_START=185 /DNA_END=2056 /DNA_ORIENTATION=+